MATNIGDAKNLAAGDENVWDDTLLIKAYDKSVKMAKEELAMRIAQSTNSKSAPAGAEKESPPSEATASNPAAGSPSVTYKIGDYVRATYEDGVDYEAKIVTINEAEGTCHIRYIGYENEQDVALSELINSWGKKARRAQFEKAAQAADETLFVNSDNNTKKTRTRPTEQDYSFGTIPPPPPMPPMLAQNHNLEDSEHLSAMLMSWYMSGYYTGVYQGMQIAKRKAKAKK